MPCGKVLAVKRLPSRIHLQRHLRWGIELLFKEWKSYANLHAFDTANAGIVEGLIWAAIGAPGGHPNSPTCGRPKFPHPPQPV